MSARRRSSDPIFGGANEVELEIGTLRRGAGGVIIELARKDGTVDRVELPYPDAGFGGSELVVSPDQHWAALFVYSGQSEVGWELFELGPTLRHAGALPYVRGEGMAPVFSPDSRYIAMAVTAGWRERSTNRHAEEALDPSAPEDESVVIDWAELYWQRIPEENLAPSGAEPAFEEHADAAAAPLPRGGGPIEHVSIGTRVPRRTEPDALFEWDLHERAQFVSSGTLQLPLPWGETLEIELPPSGPIMTGSAAPAA